MKHPGTEAEIIERLDDIQVALEAIVGHLGIDREIASAVSARRAKAEASRLEIERSLGHDAQPGDRQER